MPPQEQEGPVYDWRTGNPRVTYDWRARSLPPTLTMQDVLQALGLIVPPPAPLPGLPSVPRPVQFAFDPLGPEQGPETLGEYGGYLLGAAASIPAGSLKLLQAVPQARIHSGLLKRAAASLGDLMPVAEDLTQAAQRVRVPITPEAARLNLVRKVARPLEAHLPQNTMRVFEREGRAPLAIGRLSFDDWVKYRANLVGAPGSAELRGARRWYQDLRKTFVDVVGEADADRYLLAWASSQQQASPSKGMLDVLRAMHKLEGRIPLRVDKATKQWVPGKLGLAEKKILNQLQDMATAEGFGPKLTDFLDAVHEQKVRTLMGRDPRGGMPAPVDVWAGRDVGFVDPAIVNHIAKTYGPEAARDLVLDVGQHKFTDTGFLKEGSKLNPHQYEVGSQYYQDLAAHLNKIGFDGGGWTPDQAQAVGWVGIQKAVGRPGEGVADIFGKNTYRIGYELSPGSSSPYAQEWGSFFDELPYDEKLAMTREVLDPLIPDVAKRVGVITRQNYYGPGGYVQWVNPSGQLHIVAPPERIDDFLDVMGYVAEQQQVIASRPKASASTPAMKVMFDLDPKQGQAKLGEFWEAVKRRAPEFFVGKARGADWEVAPGFSPYEQEGRLGLVLYRPDGTRWPTTPASQKLYANFMNALNESAQEVGLAIDDARSVIIKVEARSRGNDWSRHGDGQAYLDSLRTRGRSDLSEWLVREVRPRADQAVSAALAKRGFRKPLPAGAAIPVPSAGAQAPIAPVPSHGPMTLGGLQR